MTNFRKGMTALVVVAAMAGTEALAADGVLAPGKPAGVEQARLRRPNLLLIGGAAAVAVAGIAIAVSNSNNAGCDEAHCPTTPPTATTG